MKTCICKPLWAGGGKGNDNEAEVVLKCYRYKYFWLSLPNCSVTVSKTSFLKTALNAT